MAFQIPEYIRSMIPYVPGKPIEETQREFGLKKVIKLASNENPLGPSPKAKKAVQSHLKDLHRYPDGGGHHLKKALSKNLQVPTSSLILGNGSNEIIDLLIRTFCLPGDSIVTHQASFIAYKLCAQIHGVKTQEVPLNEDLHFNANALIDAVRKNEKARVVFLANPNNPTGRYLSFGEIQNLLTQIATIRDGSVLVALDYAYWEYIVSKDLLPTHEQLGRFSNLIMLRTFSKVYGLAGLRIGYGVSSPEIISQLEKVRQPFNISSLALVGAEAALGDVAFVKKAKKANREGMSFWEKNLSKAGIPFWKSQGNFILIDVKKGLGKTGIEVFQKSLEKGVIFRPVANYGLPNALRISMGTSLENERAFRVLVGKGK